MAKKKKISNLDSYLKNSVSKVSEIIGVHSSDINHYDIFIDINYHLSSVSVKYAHDTFKHLEEICDFFEEKEFKKIIFERVTSSEMYLEQKLEYPDFRSDCVHDFLVKDNNLTL